MTKSLQEKIELWYQAKLRALAEEKKARLAKAEEFSRFMAEIEEDCPESDDTESLGSEQPPSDYRESETGDAVDNNGRSFPDTVRAILPELPKTFTLHDVLDVLAKARGSRRSDYPATARLLKRMTERGELECIEPGAGKRPSRYTVPKRGANDLDDIFEVTMNS